MFRPIFELPLVVSGPAIVIGLSLFAMSGLVFVRKRILPHWRVNPADSEFAGAMVQSIFVFYGIALALIAVSVWQTYSDVSKVVSEEATALAALYRDVTGYPLPLREELQQQLKEYTRLHRSRGLAITATGPGANGRNSTDRPVSGDARQVRTRD